MSHSDDPQVNILSLKRIGTGALQNAKVLVVLLHCLVDSPHGLHGLHSTGHHHWPPCYEKHLQKKL